MGTSINEKFQAGLEPIKKIDKRKHASVSSASVPRDDWVTININEAQNPFDPVSVPVQVNGRAYQIQRGVNVSVPPEVVHSLDNAVIDKAYPNIDQNGMPAGIVLRPTKRFPYQIVDEGSMKRYHAWLKASLDVRDAQIEAERVAA